MYLKRDRICSHRVRVQEVQWAIASYISHTLDCIMHVKWQDQILRPIYSVQKK